MSTYHQYVPVIHCLLMKIKSGLDLTNLVDTFPQQYWEAYIVLLPKSTESLINLKYVTVDRGACLQFSNSAIDFKEYAENVASFNVQITIISDFVDIINDCSRPITCNQYDNLLL